jgi:trehalose-phosphatase
LIVITGRSAREIVPLLGFTPIPEIWGTYGLERLYGDGSRWSCEGQDSQADEGAIAALAEAEILLDSASLREHTEVKLAGVAIHWRGLSPAETLSVRAKAYKILEPLARQHDLVMGEFDAGVELRLRSANKANALKRFLYELTDDLPVAYLGDDASDEDAFRVLNGRGLTVLVRPKKKFTSAQVWLRPPEDLITFLKDWVRASRSQT